MNGLGTLLFILITKDGTGFLGSSFAFLAPAGIVISKWGYDYALGCFVAVGLLRLCSGIDYLQVRFWRDQCGSCLRQQWVPLAALIGLELAGTAASNAGLKDEVLLPANIIVFLVTL